MEKIWVAESFGVSVQNDGRWWAGHFLFHDDSPTMCCSLRAQRLRWVLHFLLSLKK